MKSYLIDEISISDLEKVKKYLSENAKKSEVEKLFWVEMSEACLNKKQLRHKECQPYRFAIEIGNHWIKAEFFIRASGRLMCSCNGYCDFKQRNFIFDFMENMEPSQIRQF